MYVLDDVQTRAHITVCGNRSTRQPIYGFGVIGVIVLVTIFVAITVMLSTLVSYYETIYNKKREENYWNCMYQSLSEKKDCGYDDSEDEAKMMAELWEMLVPLVNSCTRNNPHHNTDHYFKDSSNNPQQKQHSWGLLQ